MGLTVASQQQGSGSEPPADWGLPAWFPPGVLVSSNRPKNSAWGCVPLPHDTDGEVRNQKVKSDLMGHSDQTQRER